MVLWSHRVGVAVEPHRFLFQRAFGARKQPKQQQPVARLPWHPLARTLFGRRVSQACPSPCEGEGEERDAMRPSFPLPRGCATKENTEVTFACCSRRLAHCSQRCSHLCIWSFVASPISTFFCLLLTSPCNGVSEVLLRICEDVYEADEASNYDDMAASSDDD
ncbi:hypothetical protein ISCGN_011430 [Ixodes scapularis]